MSDESSEPEVQAADGPSKKKSKLPVVIVLVLLLGGGGFFAMKLRGGKAKPEIKLSNEKAVELKEFLVNLKDRGVYCRTEIALGVAEGTKPTLVDDHVAAVRDAINLRITSKSLAELDTREGLMQLKRDIASDLNKILADKPEEKPPEDAGDSDTSTDKPEPKTPAKGDVTKPEAPVHPEWDSDTGPILKVYFESFATQ